ncbi:hypothetical protein LTS16_007749 [Friedmanniomyces endolithicus]|nr:hypothetical protein LTS16_007749 [Friedmanniomyces endolithicus]
MGGPRDAPSRFPCWCQATYSWGGETKKDLGFIEGDLIEALNAGDGLWWMGRLRRDPRAIGLFPSNFVKVLDESFQPAPNSRRASPLNAAPSPSPSPAKSKSVFRKPFDAYEKAGPRGSLDGNQNGSPQTEKEPVRKEKSKFRPYSSMKTAPAPNSMAKKAPAEDIGPRIPAPPPRGHHSHRTSRALSPLPHPRSGGMSASPTPTPGYAAPTATSIYRAVSPQPSYRGPSPAPSRAPSPLSNTYHDGSAFPQLLPASRKPSPSPYQQHDPYGSRAPSPAPSRAPSPLPGTYHDGSAFPQLLPASRRPSPSPLQQFDPYGSRAPSPAPPSHDLYQHHGAYGSRAPSPAPPSPNPYQARGAYGSRAPSPAPSFGYQQSWRAPSPAPYEDGLESPPPPPPPAHRVAYQPSRAPSMVQQHARAPYDRGASRTPVPPSPSGDGGSHMTPSPLRDAMNDVMSSLHDMSMYQDPTDVPPPPLPSGPIITANIWSPDEFELVRSRSQAQHQRAQSSMGFAGQDDYFQHRHDKTPSLPTSRDGPPELENYVQRMERKLRHVQSNVSHSSGQPPEPPLKGSQFATSSSRPTTSSSQSSHGSYGRSMHSQQQHPKLKQRKSAFELGQERLTRTYTTKTNATNSTDSSSATQTSTSTAATSRSIMSGYSAGGFSATSAGSLARRKFGLRSQRGQRPASVAERRSVGDMNSSARSMAATESVASGPSYHESHASFNQPLLTPTADWTKDPMDSAGVLGGLGGLSAPKARKSGFFKKMIASAKTGAASARSTLGSANGSRPGSRAGSPTKSLLAGSGPTAIAGGSFARADSAFGGGGAAARDMGLGGGGDWMQVRRDINRSNSLSHRERDERIERCEMLDLPVLSPIDQLHELTEGDEGLDGLCVSEPTDFNTTSLALVDKSTRFVQNVPPMVTAKTLAQGYICRPYRTDVQCLRAIFTWVTERITWEEDYEGEVDTRRVISTKRGCSAEIAVLVREMCSAMGLHAEEVHGYLKGPGEVLDLDTIARPNHWWNAVIIDGEWRIMDCSLANPSNPRRSIYSSASSQVAESWYFLARPSEICYTHIPLLPEQQHVVPPVDHEVLIALPCATPAYHRHGCELADFNTSQLHMENLEMTQLHITVPEDIECVAETSARAFARDADGDLFESGETVTKPAFAQPSWNPAGRKHYTIKALLPSDEGQGVLKIYAGKRGLMHSLKDNPHALALALPLSHTGANPAYDFHVRHPTPHAQRHDLYVVQPQCGRLTVNNTFVFCVRQHPSSLSRFTPDTWGSHHGRPASPVPGSFAAGGNGRPGSAMSMMSATASAYGSEASSVGSGSGGGAGGGGGAMTAAQQKPAKLAIQSPSQKIIRLTRKQEHGSASRGGGGGGGQEEGLTTAWETVIKIGERGTWRGLVLADRSARWCVFAEWECL